MPAERYYHPTTFAKGDTLFLEDQEYHHLLHVMRIREGETVEIVNGCGQLAAATVQKLEKKRAILSLTIVEHAPPPKAKLILAQGTPRQNRLDFIIEKGTELGVTEFRLFPAEKGEKKGPTDGQKERLKSVAIAAMKQCGRLYLPEITYMPPLEEWTSPNITSYFGDTRPEAPSLLKRWNQETVKHEVMFFIGPESGFSDKEVAAMVRLGATGVTLHPNILRTDTAAIAALSVISQLIF